MSVNDSECPAWELNTLFVGQFFKLKTAFPLPVLNNIIIPSDSDQLTRLWCQLFQYIAATDIPGMYNYIAVIHPCQYPWMNDAMGIRQNTY